VLKNDEYFWNPSGYKEAVGRSWGGSKGDFNQLWRHTLSRWQQTENILSRAGLPLPKGKVLEFGSGMGLLDDVLDDSVSEILMLDNTKNYILERPTPLSTRCRHSLFTPDSLHQLQLNEKNNFDWLLSIAVFYHIDETTAGALLEELGQLVNEGGHILVREWNEWSLNDVQKLNNFDRIFNEYPRYFIDSTRLSKILSPEFQLLHRQDGVLLFRKAIRSDLHSRTPNTLTEYSVKPFRVAVVVEGMSESQTSVRPWSIYQSQLETKGIFIDILPDIEQAFAKQYDAMLLDVWLDWANKAHFNPSRTMRLIELHAKYREQFPQTIQITHNHTDMSRRPYAVPFWRPGDPVLFRTPAYNRAELAPFDSSLIWSYEKIWGSNCFAAGKNDILFPAGFIGTTSGPDEYRVRVATQTAKVGIGICESAEPLPLGKYHEKLSACQIVVCPRGWGEQSLRHWDAWLSKKPVLTDRACASVEMIPGVQLKQDVHYLVYDEPEQIPEIVAEWTNATRKVELAEIARNGYEAAKSYDGFGNIFRFFSWLREGYQHNTSVTKTHIDKQTAPLSDRIEPKAAGQDYQAKSPNINPLQSQFPTPERKSVILYFIDNFEEQSLTSYRQIRQQYGVYFDVIIVLPENLNALTLPVEFFSIEDHRITQDEASISHDFRPGIAPPLIQFYRNNPIYNHYWVVNRNVQLAGAWNDLFSRLESLHDDCLAIDLQAYKSEFDHRVDWDCRGQSLDFTIGKKDLLAISPAIYRISNKALSTLSKYCDYWRGASEIVIPTQLNASGFKIVDLAALEHSSIRVPLNLGDERFSNGENTIEIILPPKDCKHNKNEFLDTVISLEQLEFSPDSAIQTAKDSSLDNIHKDNFLLTSPQRKSLNLNLSSVFVWELCLSNYSTRQIAETIRESYPNAIFPVEQEIINILNRLFRAGYISVVKD
jgi:2-polyprenyl-3-methyl-5-hydroxy-6-metoxy-1,4-benzoquinol methylase